MQSGRDGLRWERRESIHVTRGKVGRVGERVDGKRGGGTCKKSLLMVSIFSMT